MQIQPAKDIVVCTMPDAKKETLGGILLPKQMAEEPNTDKLAIVVAVGEKMKDEYEVGDRVVIYPAYINVVMLEGVKYLFCQASNIQAKIK